MKVIRKSMPLTIRKNNNGEDEICITTPNFDRGKDRVFPEGGVLDNYLKNPIIMWIHDYAGRTESAGIPVGKNSYLRIVPEGIIAGPPIFLDGDPFAMRVKNAWDKGFLKSASIGFAPIESEPNDQGGTDYKKWEMLEWSFAPIPMNAEALRQAKSIMSAEELKEIIANAEVVDLTEPKRISQAEIKDEIDFLSEMVKEVGLSQENKTELRRISGSDMPVKDITALIKGALDACNQATLCLDGHHKAHGEAYQNTRDLIKKCQDSLGKLSPSDMPDLPCDDEETEMESLSLAFSQSVKTKFGG